MASARFFTLSDFGRYHCSGVAIQCRVCRHSRQVALKELYGRLGFTTRIGDAQQRLRCGRCGRKAARLIPIP